MSRLTYNVLRRPGGWAVESETEVHCCFRRLEQAVARARELGRDGWKDGGRPSQVRVQTIHGAIRTEAVYGQGLTAS